MTDAEMIAALRAERDRLRGHLERVKAERDVLFEETMTWHDQERPVRTELRLIKHERDLLRADLARVTAERDEARAAHGALIKNYGDVMDERNAAIVRCNETAERIAAWVEDDRKTCLDMSSRLAMTYAIEQIRAGAWKETK
jgi:uncharacterized coiled-coil DUF342 family protein